MKPWTWEDCFSVAEIFDKILCSSVVYVLICWRKFFELVQLE